MTSHSDHRARLGPLLSTPCTPATMTFGNKCLNCGWNCGVGEDVGLPGEPRDSAIESSYDPEVEEQLAREFYGPKGYGKNPIMVEVEYPAIRPSTIIIWLIVLALFYVSAFALYHLVK